ncbi:hypothetical protein LEP1GSC173_3517 [Leptospira interrogans str. HAI1594]|uniref:Uncharacterized protein n=1 Tax=Leptospira interrogans serovar Manilae TaxID=214675 RepID=A0AAQ1NXK8_LEPIR|nr:hypothetical protein LEP1GSC173_3517 [Leptospira interrogans str. HAI1594]SOR61670.1 conserved hypothetical protein [Leptospira interrogans serovar Manilae]
MALSNEEENYFSTTLILIESQNLIQWKSYIQFLYGKTNHNLYTKLVLG